MLINSFGYRPVVPRAGSPATPKPPAEAAERPYYDSVGDRADQRRYYAGLSPSADPVEFYRQLNDLVTRTHENRLDYDPKTHLHPWIDLRPSLRLHSLYSTGETHTTDPVRVRLTNGPETREPRPGKKPKRSRGSHNSQRRQSRQEKLEEEARQLSEAIARSPADAPALAARIALLEAQQHFNCEHIVPRIWFGDQKPMLGDLHHMFTSEVNCNSARSSRRLYDFPDYEGDSGDMCGLAPEQDDRFEPAAGKGAAARATLYFLVRYPRWIGNNPREYQAEDIDTLLRWHAEDPPGLYEQHRNQYIFAEQGNRNPFIDHPEWAHRVDFTQGLARPRPKQRAR